MTDHDEYEQTFPSPVPLPDFYATGKCWYCHKHYGFFRHHIRLNQNRVTVIQCPHCSRYTRVKLNYQDGNLVLNWIPKVRVDLTTGVDLG